MLYRNLRADNLAPPREVKIMIKKILLGLSIVALTAVGGAIAQQAAIKRTPLQKAEFPDSFVSVSAIAEIPAGGAAGRHSHPGIELGYIIEGEADLILDGKPAQHLKAGDSYQVSTGVIHDAKVSGDKALKVLTVYIVDKSKPLASPAP
jgi:quercetin dioxygenase-like cupin family protein